MKTTPKPEVTLIVSSSVDGCLVGRDSDRLDQQKNWKDLPIVRGVVQQFYDFVNNSDVYNLTTADVMIGLGLNNQSFSPKKDLLNLIVLDVENELTPLALQNLAKSVENLIVIVGSSRPTTLDSALPSNVQLLRSEPSFDPVKIMRQLKKVFHVKKVTIQSAGQLNSQWLNANIVDYLTVVVYPLVVSSNGSASFPTATWLKKMTVKPLQLISAQTFDTNYVSLRYRVINT